MHIIDWCSIYFFLDSLHDIAFCKNIETHYQKKINYYEADMIEKIMHKQKIWYKAQLKI